MSGASFARPEAGGILVDVRLTPRGGRDAVEGPLQLGDGRLVLAARVRAVPEKGGANLALAAVIAAAFDVPKSAVTLVSGQTSRVKTLRIAGDAAALMARAAALAG